MIVVKIGGSVANLDPILDDLAHTDEKFVVVHGASRALNALSTQLGTPPRMVESERGEVSRFTDSTTMDQFLMAYAGSANKRIVERLRQRGVDAFGLCGLDGGVVSGIRRPDLRVRANGKTRVLHDNHVGRITAVDGVLLATLLGSGLAPVICPPIAAEDGTAINVDGDRLAAEIAVALAARMLIIFVDTPGLLRDPTDESTLVRQLTCRDADELLSTVGGRARVKLRAAADARRRGVGAVGIADGRRPQPVSFAIASGGTWLR